MQILPVVAAVPWLLYPLVTVWRLRGSPNLATESDTPPPDADFVSVIVPARNEARNIGRCVQSILASSYLSFELIVVDDRSDDDTAAIARAAAGHEPMRVITAPPLPEGWFGKQWALAQGAAAARGSVLLFTDADTVHERDLLTRVTSAMRARSLDFVTVAGRQELGSFWERVVQPHVFAMLAARFGGPGEVNRSRRVADKMANGQCMCVTREAYDAVGGVAAVRGKVAEDVAMAQRLFAHGRRTEVVLGPEQLTTRMYASLGEIVRGWRKNMYVGSMDVMPFGRAGRIVLAPLLLALPVLTLAPAVTLLAALALHLPMGVTIWAALCSTVLVVWWAFVYHEVAHASVLYALLFPLGAAVVLYIACGAIARGRSVEWKGRSYQAA